MRRFSSGTSYFSDSACIEARASTSRRAATGSRSAHVRGVGGPSPRGPRCGSSDSGIVRADSIASAQRLA